MRSSSWWLRDRDARSGKAFVPTYANVLKLTRGYGLRPDKLLVLAGHGPGVELASDEWEVIGLYHALQNDQRLRMAVAEVYDHFSRDGIVADADHAAPPSIPASK